MQELKLNDILNNTSDLTKEKLVVFVSIIGRPNSGKSTFINTLLGEKVAITSSVPQTTRKSVLGIYNDDNSQIIFTDTPGIHKSEKIFNKKLNLEATKSLKETDLVLYFVDSSREMGEEEQFIIDILDNIDKPILKIFTKSDLKPKIPVNNGIKISSISKEGIDELLTEIKKFAKKQIIPFPEDFYTKQDMFFRVSEIIREKIFLNTKEEIPHSIFVRVEEIEDKNDLLRIIAYIYTETDSQKYIIIGRGGALLSKIGKEARLELEQIFGRKVFLGLRVKTEKSWRKNEKLIEKLI